MSLASDEYAEDLFKYKDFKGFGNFTNKFLVTFGNALNATSDTTYKLKLIFAVIGFVVNIFHLMILTRKPMRTSCINVIMVGMGIADFINMTYYLYVELYGIVQNNEWYINYFGYLSMQYLQHKLAALRLYIPLFVPDGDL